VPSPFPDIRQEAYELAQAEMTAREIYHQLRGRHPDADFAFGTVKAWVRDAGGPRDKGPTVEELDKIVDLLDAGLGVVEVAREVGRSHSAVGRWYRQAKGEVDLRGAPKDVALQAKEVRDEAISEVTWWAKRCTDLDWGDLQRRLRAIDKPDYWWRRRREWTIGEWAEYALGHGV